MKREIKFRAWNKNARVLDIVIKACYNIIKGGFYEIF